MAQTPHGPKAQLGLPVPGLQAGALTLQPLTLEQHLEQVRAGVSPLPRAQLDALRVLLVPGFYWDKAPGYFDPNLRRLAELGVEASVVPVDPIAPSRSNAKIVRDALTKSGKPTIIIAHSKGGRDSVHALRGKASPVKLVAVQSPLGGQAAAWLATRWPLWSHFFAAAVGRGHSPLLAGQTLQELSEEITPPPGWLDLFTVGGTGDLIVSAQKALLPGSRQALIQGLGHLDWVLGDDNIMRRILLGSTLPGNYAGDFTEALLRWVLASEAPTKA